MCDCKAASNSKDSVIKQIEKTPDLQTSSQDILHAGGGKTGHPENRLDRKGSSGSPNHAISAKSASRNSTAGSRSYGGEQKAQTARAGWYSTRLARKGACAAVATRVAGQTGICTWQKQKQASAGLKMMMKAMARTVTPTGHCIFFQTQYRVFTYSISQPSHTTNEL